MILERFIHMAGTKVDPKLAQDIEEDMDEQDKPKAKATH
jgi:hypothetical protein